MQGKLHPVNLGLALGISLAIFILFLGVTANAFDWGSEIVEVIGTFYLGYSTSIGGSILGAIWGFIDGFIGGFAIAYIYNTLQK